MSTPTPTMTTEAPLNLAPFKKVPMILVAIGVIGLVLGYFYEAQKPVLHPNMPGSQAAILQLGYSWLQAFMFCLSFVMGSMFMVLAHHLFDASWSVGFRRINEHIACLSGIMLLFFIPIALLAPKLYPWMTSDPNHDHALAAKLPLFTRPMFYIVAALCFGLWIFYTWMLRRESVLQDSDGDARHTLRNRVLSATGIFVFAFTFTIAAIMWMKALMHEWFSTMYGVWYFAGSTWLALITVYMIGYILQRQGPLREVLKQKQFYFQGSVFFAFTVFYAYVTFAQYFIIWNANMPEETFWYVLRERGSWWGIGMIIIFGHFFVPFLALLRIDAKLTPWLMSFLCLWAWLMHFLDMSFNIMPVFHKDGFVLHPMDVGAVAFMVGILAIVFLKSYASTAPYPIRDPRLAEGLDVYIPSDTTGATTPAGGNAH